MCSPYALIVTSISQQISSLQDQDENEVYFFKFLFENATNCVILPIRTLTEDLTVTEKELKKLGKSELIDLLAQKDAEAATLRSQVAFLERQLSENTAQAKSIGSIAEAALKVNGVFTAAQKAADEYLAAVMDMNTSAEKRCQDMIDRTRDYCDKLQSDTRYKCTAMETDAKNRCAELLCDAQEKAKSSLSSVTIALRDYYLRNEDKLRELPADLQRLIRSPR